jgi:hypothetical protein
MPESTPTVTGLSGRCVRNKTKQKLDVYPEKCNGDACYSFDALPAVSTSVIRLHTNVCACTVLHTDRVQAWHLA